MKTLICTILVLSALTSTSLVRSQPRTPPSTTKKTALICPITGDKIASVKAAVGHSTYKGKTYYFCCKDCKPRFDKDPATAVKNAKAGKFQKM